MHTWHPLANKKVIGAEYSETPSMCPCVEVPPAAAAIANACPRSPLEGSPVVHTSHCRAPTGIPLLEMHPRGLAEGRRRATSRAIVSQEQTCEAPAAAAAWPPGTTAPMMSADTREVDQLCWDTSPHGRSHSKDICVSH